jgi:F-type H+-transporting ATPase subunit alpha
LDPHKDRHGHQSRRNFQTHSRQIGSFTATVDVAEVGTVIAIGDGISRVHGIERAMAGEMLEFPHGVFGIALNLEEESVGAVLLGDSRKSRKATRSSARAHHLGPVGDEMLGASSTRSAADRRQRSDHDEAVSADRTSRPGVVDRSR